MKKLIAILIAVVFAIPAFQACKKGENDPGLSLKSRSAKLKGEWKMTAGTETETYTDTDGDIDTDVSTFDGTTGTYTYTSSGSSTPNISTGGFTSTITFEKDGTYKQVIVSSYSGTGYSGSTTITTDGVWYWAGKNKELEIKNKEALILSYTTVTTANVGTYGTITTNSSNTKTYDSVGADESYLFDKLSSKEMIVTVDETNTETSSSYTGTETTAVVGSYTYEKQ